MVKKFRMFVLSGLVVAGSLIFLSQAQAADVYKIDAAHSSLGFSVSHLMVSKTTGVFNEYEGAITFDAKDLAASSAQVTIQMASIDTRSQKRDDHLRSADFFDATANPQITFKSKQIASSGEGYLITGDLTLKGVTKEIAIPVKITGPVVSPFGATVIGLAGQVTINRQDFGVSWNKALDNGGVMVGDNVDVQINIEAQKQ